MKTKGKHVALVAILAGIPILLVTVFFLRGKILEQWYIYQLDSNHPDKRITAAIKLVEMGSARAIPYLARQVFVAWRELRSANDKIKFSDTDEWELLLTIVQSGGKDSAGELEKVLDDRDYRVRRISALLLGTLGPKSVSAVPSLLKKLSDPKESVRLISAHALSRIGAGSREALVPLINALNDGESRIRFYVADTLGKIGPGARMAVPRLKKMINNPKGQ